MSTTILVIEDEISFRRAISAFLQDSGYRVVEAGNGQEGLDVFQREHPSIVLTDLRMPVMNGVQVITWLRQNSPSTPILVITGTGDRQAIAAVINQGARGCIVKPISDMRVLESAIVQVLGSPDAVLEP